MNFIHKTKTDKSTYPGDSNDIARKNREHRESLDSKQFAQGFEHINWNNRNSKAELVQNRGGIKTYKYKEIK